MLFLPEREACLFYFSRDAGEFVHNHKAGENLHDWFFYFCFQKLFESGYIASELVNAPALSQVYFVLDKGNSFFSACFFLKKNLSVTGGSIS